MHFFLPRSDSQVWNVTTTLLLSCALGPYTAATQDTQFIFQRPADLHTFVASVTPNNASKQEHVIQVFFSIEDKSWVRWSRFAQSTATSWVHTSPSLQGYPSQAWL